MSAKFVMTNATRGVALSHDEDTGFYTVVAFSFGIAVPIMSDEDARIAVMKALQGCREIADALIEMQQDLDAAGVL